MGSRFNPFTKKKDYTGSGSSIPSTTAENDFIIGSSTIGTWVKKTLAQTITILRTSLDSIYATTGARTATFTVGTTGSGADYICDGTADNVQIQAAIDALPAGGGKIFIRAGTYNTAVPIYLSSYTAIEGEGDETIIFLSAGSHCPVFINEHADDGTATEDIFIKVTNLKIDCNYANNAGSFLIDDNYHYANAITLVDVTNATIRDLTILNSGPWAAIYASLSDVNTALSDSDISICGNYIDTVGAGTDTTAMGGQGIWVLGRDYSVDRIRIQNNTIKNVLSPAGQGIAITKGAGKVICTGNIIENIPTNGIQLYGQASPATSLVEDCVVSGNIIDNVGTTFNPDVLADGNGIYIKTNSLRHIVANNRVNKAGRAGIYINNSGTHFKCIVSNNICTNNGQIADVARADTARAGIDVAGRDITVTGNICSDNQVTKTQHYGISGSWAAQAETPVSIILAHNNVSDNDLEGIYTTGLARTNALVFGNVGADDNTPASSIVNTPAGNIIATTVQAAIDELDTEKQAAMGLDDNYVTDAEKIVIGNTSGTNTGDEPDASTTVKGIVELAINTEVNTGTSDALAATPDAIAGSYAGTKSVVVQTVDGATDVSVADGKAYFVIPAALSGMNLVSANARVITAGTTNATTIDIYNVTDSQDMLSGAISIASGDVLGTAGTVNASYDDVATNDCIRIDVTTASTTNAKGLIVFLEFRLP